jgi:anti-sigma factor RsiW
MRLRRRWRRANPLACREFVELVTDYLDGALPPDERSRLEAHLAGCDGCTGYLQDVRMIAATLPEIELPAADPATQASLLQAFRELRQG